MKKIFLFSALTVLTVNLHALRVVSLLPSYTEIIFGLGAGSELAGVSSYCNWPPETEKIEKIGDYYRPDMEKIYALKPDLVIAGDWKNSPVAENLEKLGIKVLIIPSESRVEDIFRSVKLIAAALKKEKAGVILVKKMKKELAAVRPAVPPEKIFIEADSGLWTAGGDSFLNDVIQKAGGKNIFSGLKNAYFKVSWESVIEKNPDIIITLSSSTGELAGLPMADKVEAVRTGKIYRFEGAERDAFSRPSPRITGVISSLSRLINGKDRKNLQPESAVFKTKPENEKK